MTTKFVVDQMLGRLAKWLRVLGFDTLYSTSLDDPDLARLALAEDRILLTRDTQLARRRRLRCLLVRSDDPREQLRQVVEELCLPLPAEPLTRCLRCNELLADVDKTFVEARLPPYVRLTQEHFRRCAACGRVYWRGTHWERMHRALVELAGPREAGSDTEGGGAAC